MRTDPSASRSRHFSPRISKMVTTTGLEDPESMHQKKNQRIRTRINASEHFSPCISEMVTPTGLEDPSVSKSTSAHESGGIE
jgi:hypothetical protein